MTYNEIIKALECCSHRNGDLPCEGCPAYSIAQMCMEDLMSDALDLINRQKAEIERLKKEVEDKERAYNDEFCLRKEYQSKCREFLKEKQTTKSEAIKEFVEMLKEKYGTDSCIVIISKNDIDNLVKEMTEENENDRA